MKKKVLAIGTIIILFLSTDAVGYSALETYRENNVQSLREEDIKQHKRIFEKLDRMLEMIKEIHNIELGGS